MSDGKRSRIEDLSNEIWLEIFDYLDWINLFLAFYGINKRINQLLVSIKTLSLYSSYLVNQSNSIYLFFQVYLIFQKTHIKLFHFQEFPIEQFKQIQHLQLIYEGSSKDALNIAKHLPSFSTLTSLTVDIKCTDYDFKNELMMIYLRQRYPFLQRLYLHGDISEYELEITDDVCMFYFPSLIYIHVAKLHFTLVIQILNQCRQLRSFSAELCGQPVRDSSVVSSILSPTRFNMNLTAMKKLHLGADEFWSNEFVSIFLELVLPCCPNLRTFSFKFVYLHLGKKPIDPNWWIRVFASNNKLKRISLHLFAHGIPNRLNEEILQKFRLLPFFAQLKVNITYKEHRIEFPRMIFEYSIHN